ncbi:hypothetical protein, partial [Salmonella enterica]|uniref:hypothetical protein n=1 Tax=Salmonella enterica TaxID=28901 RepID=UPI000AC050F8
KKQEGREKGEDAAVREETARGGENGSARGKGGGTGDQGIHKNAKDERGNGAGESQKGTEGKKKRGGKKQINKKKKRNKTNTSYEIFIIYTHTTITDNNIFFFNDTSTTKNYT